MECGEADRLARQHGFDPGQRQRFAARRDAVRSGDGGQRLLTRLIIFGTVTLGKTANVHRGKARQRLQQMVRTDTVAAIRWKRHTVGKEQNLPHHASPRAIHGPSVLAMGSGSFFQSSILRL